MTLPVKYCRSNLCTRGVYDFANSGTGLTLVKPHAEQARAFIIVHLSPAARRRQANRTGQRELDPLTPAGATCER